MDGKGIYQVGEKKYKLSKGQGFLIEPEALTFYQADQEEPWSYLWVGVGGTGAKKFIQDIGLNSQQRIFRCADGEKLNEIVMDMMKHTRSTGSDLYYLQGKLYELFSVLASDVVIEELMEENKENRYIQEAVTYIRNHYAAGLTVEELAGYLGVNRSYLYTLFKNKLQLSPKEFLTKFRISRAREQLILTEESVENIAVACGYHSTLVFTKNFKQETGMTPTEFRKTSRQAAKDRLLMNQKSPGTGKN